MAEDVNTTPRILENEKYPSLRASATGRGGQFRATELWNDIVATLKSEVDVKRRRVKMKSHNSCFTGADAVDVVLQKLQKERINFTKEVSRDKALKLCKVLMESKVFEPVSKQSEDSKSEFDDSSSKLYRFTDEDGKEIQDDKSQGDSSLEEGDKKDDKNGDDLTIYSPAGHRVRQAWTEENPSSPGMKTEDMDCGADSADAQGKQGHIAQLLDITGAWKRHSAECLRKITPAKIFQRRGSLSSINIDGETPKSRRDRLPPAVLNEIRQEVVISRLLTLVEIPILDDILRFDCNAPCHRLKKKPMAYSNLAFKRQESMCSLFEKKDEDFWQESATDLLELCPKGDEVLDMSYSDDSERTRKLRLYVAIADHYRELSPPLWAIEFTDLQVALLNLLMQGRRGTVLQALQLSMMLLPSQTQEEIYRILTFIFHASRDNAIKLSNNTGNRDHLENVFTSAIIKNKVLAPHQAAQVVWFLVDHREAVFSAPPDVEDAIQARLEGVLQGRFQTPMELIYCHQVSYEEFRRQQLDETQNALVELMNNILDRTDVTLKEKKQRLKQFQKHHPELHKEFFADIH